MYIAEINIKKPKGLGKTEEGILFYSDRPLTIQPSAIMKISLNILLKIEEDFILMITSHFNLLKQYGQLFPSTFILDHSVEKQYPNGLELNIQNMGKNNLTILPAQPVAIGYILKNFELPITSLSLKEFINKEETLNVEKKGNIVFGVKN